MTSVAAKRIVLLDDPDYRPEEPWMEFRLTYRGPLRTMQEDPAPGQPDRRSGHKHTIRREFHRQLRRLWSDTPFLATGERSGPGAILEETGSDIVDYRAAVLAEKHKHLQFKLVPLVTAELKLLCGLDILFLRPDLPRRILWAGDIDNRLKTLFDALRKPSPEEFQPYQYPPAPDEAPFYCLLEDDRLITKVAVETDQFLDFTGADQAEVLVVITVTLRPYDVSFSNLQFT